MIDRHQMSQRVINSLSAWAITIRSIVVTRACTTLISFMPGTRAPVCCRWAKHYAANSLWCPSGRPGACSGVARGVCWLETAPSSSRYVPDDSANCSSKSRNKTTTEFGSIPALNYHWASCMLVVLSRCPRRQSAQRSSKPQRRPVASPLPYPAREVGVECCVTQGPWHSSCGKMARPRRPLADIVSAVQSDPAAVLDLRTPMDESSDTEQVSATASVWPVFGEGLHIRAVLRPCQVVWSIQKYNAGHCGRPLATGPRHRRFSRSELGQLHERRLLPVIRAAAGPMVCSLCSRATVWTVMPHSDQLLPDIRSTMIHG